MKLRKETFEIKFVKSINRLLQFAHQHLKVLIVRTNIFSKIQLDQKT